MVRESRETDEVLVCMAQRLQSQLERQLTLVERLQVHGGDETLADLAELRTSLQRSLRGSENVLVLAGAIGYSLWVTRPRDPDLTPA